jgi:hypothetical protein
MTAASILLLIQGIQAAIAAAPQAVAVVKSAKDLFDAMATAKAITTDQQNALKSHVDSLQALALAGIIAPHWLVQPDPA